MATDNRMKMIGTVKFNNVEPCNKIAVKAAIELLEDCPRGSWCLVPAYDPVEVFTTKKDEKIKRKNKNLVFRRIGIDQTTPTTNITIGSGASSEIVKCVVADRAGYILFKDNKIVAMYSNDLASNVPIGVWVVKPTDRPTDALTSIVRGMSFVKRWTEEKKALRKSRLLVPAVVVAYNKFMNAVDVMDQYRGYCATKRKEQRLSTAMFGFVVDLCVHNAFAVYNQLQRTAMSNQWIQKEELPVLRFQEFKRRICEALVRPTQEDRARAKRASLEGNVPQLCEKNKRRMRIQCYLCVHFGTSEDPRCSFFCQQCNRGFHPECFNVWHNPQCVYECRPDIYEMVEEAREETLKKPRTENASKKACPSMEDVVFPFSKEE